MKQSLCLGLVVAWLLAAAGGTASAQSAPAPAPAPANKDSKDAKPDAKGDAKADAKADAEAMERARRLAANPMRIILEASRVRRRDAEAAGTPIVPVVATSAAAPAAVVAQPAADVAPRAAPVPARETPPPEPAAAVISSELTQTKAPTAAAPALVATPVAQPVAASTPPLPTLASLSPQLARPQLITRVDPDPPQRLLVDLEPNTVITAELTIRPDGSVGQVAIVSSNARALGRYVVTALQQWRFAPLPSERQWRVDLLFRPDE